MEDNHIQNRFICRQIDTDKTSEYTHEALKPFMFHEKLDFQLYCLEYEENITRIIDYYELNIWLRLSWSKTLTEWPLIEKMQNKNMANNNKVRILSEDHSNQSFVVYCCTFLQ